MANKQHKNDQKMFEEFLKSFNMDYNDLSTNEVEEWYGHYMSTMGNMMSEIDENSERVKSFLDMDFTDGSFHEYLKTQGSSHLEKLMFYLTDPIFMRKFNDFVDRHDMKLIISLDKDGGYTMVDEQWSSDCGILLNRKYALTRDVYPTLVDKVRKKIISKKLEMSYDIEKHEIDSLSLPDKIKYYEFVLQKAVETEDFEKAAVMRDVLDSIKQEH